MTSRPRLATDINYLNGLAAIALFAVMFVVFASAGFPLPDPGAFGGASVTRSIGFAMFALNDQAAFGAENFLVAFEIIDIVLVAALVGAVMLARREEDESLVTVLADGGRRLRDRGDADDDAPVTDSDADGTADATITDSGTDSTDGSDPASDVREGGEA